MLVKQARDAARQWVTTEAWSIPGFAGAYFAGSATWLPDDALLPATSDVDVMVVLADANPPNKPGKLHYGDVLLEVSYMARDRLRSPEQVLGDYHLASAFRAPSVIVDPSGQLTALQAAVTREFARRDWVRRRCEHAADGVRRWARALDETAPLHDQVTVSVFAAGVTTDMLLVAALENPTVRRRYAAVREVLAAYGRLDFHEPLLALLGCAKMDRQRVEHHLAGVTAVFDAAKVAIKTPYRFGSDISDAARPISIDGSRELIERDLHREAVFWIAATYSRCRHIFAADAPHLEVRFDRGYRELLGDLGISSFPDRRRRCEEVEAFLPRLWHVAEEILAANQEIRD
jgi:hypothetical protein